MELEKKWMAGNTRRVFEVLAAEPLLAEFTLIGGTAMALQVGHRKSEDIDLWTCAEHLDKRNLSIVMERLRQLKMNVSLATPHDLITQAKINGVDLLRHAQDYVVDNVKVTLFARADGPFFHFNSFGRVESSASFGLMGLDGLFAMKSYAISQRVKSRDLFDLMYFIENEGKAVFQIIEEASAVDCSVSKEYLKDVLLGAVPVEKGDEGFASLGIETELSEIYKFFAGKISVMEKAQAARAFKAGKGPSM